MHPVMLLLAIGATMVFHSEFANLDRVRTRGETRAWPIPKRAHLHRIRPDEVPFVVVPPKILSGRLAKIA